MLDRPISTTHLSATRADRHQLYEASVQDPETDIRFIQRVYRKEHGRGPTRLREDFCGTAFLSAQWVRRHPKHVAIGIDLHEPTLRWGRRHHVDPLGENAGRVLLLNQNVLDRVPKKADVTVAFNFSYCVFHTRRELVFYAKTVRRGLMPGGAMILDIHGGLEATAECEEETEHESFTYVWDQLPYDAITGLGKRHIHFRFADGSEMRRAFTYDWRIWTLPELREILEDAGFSRVDIYWEGADDDGSGNGIFRRQKRAREEESWIAYVVAWR